MISIFNYVIIVGTVISIAFFNFAGVSVTKELSATTRMVLDSVRTLVIWSASLMLQWQKFYWPQVDFTCSCDRFQMNKLLFSMIPDYWVCFAGLGHGRVQQYHQCCNVQVPS